MTVNGKKAASHGRYTSKSGAGDLASGLLDRTAILVQKLRGRSRGGSDQPLVRLEYRPDDGEAPYIFDSVKGVLHRRGCNAIPPESKSALYAVSRMERRDRKHACGECKPMPEQSEKKSNPTTDIIFGLLAIVDQFGTVLSERGKEFRETPRGRNLEKSLSGVLTELESANRQGLKVIDSTVDAVVRMINGYNGQFNDGNGTKRADAKKKPSSRTKRPSKAGN